MTGRTLAVLFVVALTVRLGYVATLRESSVVLGAAMGWLLLHEPLGGRRLVSSVIVACGLAALKILDGGGNDRSPSHHRVLPLPSTGQTTSTRPSRTP